MSLPDSLLALLQLVSPALPVGAYTYSEGLETLIQTNLLTQPSELENWLRQELRCGAMRVEAAVLVQAYRAAVDSDVAQLQSWNQWLTAFRETEELRSQSWQMGRSLCRLLHDLQPQSDLIRNLANWTEPCHFAIAFAVAAAGWQIEVEATILGYLQSWATNLVNAGVRLVPLGQTQGQQILLNLASSIQQTAAEVLTQSERSERPDQLDRLECCSWGMSLASMNHETLYSRLFRS